MTKTNSKTNSNYSFTNFNGYNAGGNNSANQSAKTGVNKPTPGQIKYYTDLCKQRNIEVGNIARFDFNTLSAEIKRLQSFYPASPKQLELAVTKVQDLTNLLGTMNFTDEQKELFGTKDGVIYSIMYSILTTGSYDVTPLLPKLTGGREGTASALIGAIIDVEKKLNEQAPVTTAQVELMVSMFFCPDIAFEDYNVLRRVEMEDSMWRKPSPQEFATMIENNFNKQQASAFIDKYRGVFYDWKNTRAKLEQISYIKSLEERMGNDSHISEVKQAVDIAGNVVEMDNTSKKEYVKGTAFTVSSDEELLQYSIEQASNYIDQLKSELERREVIEIEGEQEDIGRNVLTIEKAEEIDEETLNDILYSLEAIAGYEDPELHISPTPEKIRAFCKDMLRKGDFTYWALMEIAETSVPFQAILLDM